LASLAVLAGMNRILSLEMLERAITLRFREELQAAALDVVRTAAGDRLPDIS